MSLATAGDVDSDPDVIQRCSLPAFMTGVQHALRLNDHKCCFRLCRCSVLYTTWYDIQFARLHMNATLGEIDAQEPFEHQKSFISFRV
ncbi:hypothetical protein D3C81_1978910 [compost metagenome]